MTDKEKQALNEQVAVGLLGWKKEAIGWYCPYRNNSYKEVDDFTSNASPVRKKLWELWVYEIRSWQIDPENKNMGFEVQIKPDMNPNKKYYVGSGDTEDIAICKAAVELHKARGGKC